MAKSLVIVESPAKAKTINKYLGKDFIVKSIIARDIEDMEKYGIYECDHEDFALCAYACQSKVEVSKIVKEGLEFIEREG